MLCFCGGKKTGAYFRWLLVYMQSNCRQVVASVCFCHVPFQVQIWPPVMWLLNSDSGCRVMVQRWCSCGFVLVESWFSSGSMLVQRWFSVFQCRLSPLRCKSAPRHSPNPCGNGHVVVCVSLGTSSMGLGSAATQLGTSEAV